MKKIISILVITLFCFVVQTSMQAQVAVGSVPGQFGVSGGGGATYSLPIECPVGINGMQPNISLYYNSQGGNGIAGWGWNIGGQSAITRAKSTVYYDGVDAGVKWDVNSPYALDGQRLIITQQWNSDSIEYRTENESYSRIVGCNIQSWGPQYFKVYPKSGGVMTYGNSQSLASYAPVYTNAATDALAGTNYERTGWNLVEMKDNNGNYVNFEYATSVNSYAGNVIKNITYGNNKNKATSTNIVVTFNYEKRPDDIQGYVSGKEELQQLRLTTIVTSVNNATQKTYTLNYTGENISRLGSFELAQNGKRVFNPLSFVYGEAKKAETETSIACNSIGGFSAMDMDGDGLNEIANIFNAGGQDSSICYVMPIRKYVEGWHPEYPNTVFQISVTDRNLNRGMEGAFGDFNGNGSNESVFFRAQGGTLMATITDRKDKTILFDSTIGACTKSPFIATGNFYGNPLSGTLVVFDTPVLDAGTGMYKYPYCIVAGQLNGTISRLPAANTNFYYLYVSQKISSLSPANLNGNNLHDDLWVNYSDGTNAILKNNYASDNCFFGSSSSLVPLPFNVSKDAPYTIADMNKDGLPDVIYRQNWNDWKIAYNKGNYQFVNANLPVDCSIFRNYDTFSCNKVVLENEHDNITAVDINNDGLLDIVVGDENLGLLGQDYVQVSNSNYQVKVSYNGSSNWQMYVNGVLVKTTTNQEPVPLVDYRISATYYGFGGTTWRVYLNTGTGYTLERSFSNNKHSSFSCFADVQGNGNASWVHANSSGSTVITDFGYGLSKNTLVKVTDPFQGDQNILYKPQAAFTEYYNLLDDQNKPCTTNDYLAAGFQPFKTSSMMLVSRYENGLTKTTYHYGTPLTNWLARGFVGFRFRGTDDELTGASSFTYNKLYTDQYLMIPSRSVSSIGITVSGGQINLTNPISKNDYSYSITSLGGKRYKVQQTGQSSYDYLTQKTRTVAHEYDAFGNTTKSTKNFGDNVTEEQQVTYGAHGAWCANRADASTVTRGNAHSVNDGYAKYIRNTAYSYDNRGNLTTQTTDPGDANSVRTEYRDIDAFGHATTVAATANGITRTSAVTYTPSGRFVQSKTDQLGVTVTYAWDETKGLLNTETGVLGTTTYSYNDFNQLVQTQTPDGLTAGTTLQWATSGNALGALFYKYSVASGSAPAYIWYDAYGREIRKETYGLNAKKISVATLYNAKGMVDRVSEPFFDADEASKKWASIYAYDNYNRVNTLTTPAGATTYAYGATYTTVNSPSDVITTNVNAAGQSTTVIKNGKTVAYDYYPSGQLMTSTPAGGQAIRLYYDLQGHRTKMIDPDAGTVTSKYNGFGEQLWGHQKVHSGQDSTFTVQNYQANGLLRSVDRTTGAVTESIVYTYDAANHYRLDNVELAGKNKQKFTYGSFDRVTQQDETIGAKTFTTSVEYDALGRVSKHIYPSGYYTVNNYDTYSNLTEVTDQSSRSIWKAIDENALGQMMKISKGGKETTFGYDDRHMPTSIAAPGVQNMSFQFDTKGNLQYRTDNLTNQNEQFTYDGLNRLTNWNVYQNGTLVKQNSLTFDATTSNIASKSDLGNMTMSYGGSRADGSAIGPHALTTIAGVPASFPTADLNVTYTDFNKIATLTEGNKSYALTYGVDNQRRMSVQTQGTASLTRYYVGNYEEEVAPNGNVRKIHYLSGAMLVQNNGVDSLYYTYTDNQGSLIALTDASGNVVRKYAYDPWGARRNASDWTQKDNGSNLITNRGYTGHEHLDAFGIINMNGRVYDPATGMFLSPDPLIQSPGDWVNYNRYSYCMGNPMRYTDPSGYESAPTTEEILKKITEEYCRSYAEWYGRQFGADGLTNEQWMNATRPGADPSLYQNYVNQNRNNSFTITQTENYRNTGYYNKNGNLVQTNSELVSITIDVKITSGNDYYNTKTTLDVGGGIYGSLGKLASSSGYWLGENGKYYNTDWGGNQWTGSRAGALKAAKLYENAGRAVIVASIIIGGIETWQGIQQDGGKWGYNASHAAVSDGASILGGLAGAEAGAAAGAAFGSLFGGFGAIPGAVIGGVIGGFGGGMGGSILGGYVGGEAVDYFYDK